VIVSFGEADEALRIPVAAAFAALLGRERRLAVHVEMAGGPVATYAAFCEDLAAEAARARGRKRRDVEANLAAHRRNLASATATRDRLAADLAAVRGEIEAARAKGEA
jgi:hypothetical protein